MNSLFSNKEDFNGDLSRWNVSSVEYMGGTFEGATLFNGDLSSWNVANVVYMESMFEGATSFDRQLSGAWSTSTAIKNYMFYNSPGTIAGKTKNTSGRVIRREGEVRTAPSHRGIPRASPI